mgnify:FL=1
MTAATIEATTSLSDCQFCDDTGWLGPNEKRRECACDARPFEAATTADVNRRPATDYRSLPAMPTRLQGAALTNLELAIDRALAWSSAHMSAVVRLAHWQPYLRDGGDPSHALAVVLAAAESIEAATTGAAEVVADLQRLAINAKGAQS